MTRYYSTQRPVGIGTFPKSQTVERIENFDRRTYCPEIGREAWGFIEYREPITEKEAADYELTRMAKTLWYQGSKYNTARVIEKLADIVLDKGGRVKELEDGVIIRTRGYSEKIYRAKDLIESYKAHLKNGDGNPDNIRKAISDKEKELAGLIAAEEAAPIIKTRFAGRYGICAGSLNFVLNNVYYRFSFADNPFFPDGYSKIKLNDDGEYYGQYYGMNMTQEDEVKEYFADELWSPCASEELITAVAEDIFTRLMDAAPSERYIETERRRVPNTYNDGWHWETVTTKRGNEKHKIEF